MVNRSPETAQGTARKLNAPSCLWVGLAILVMGYLGLRGLGALLIAGDALKPADAVVPLGGGSTGRVTEAVRLVNLYPRAVLILTEPGEVKAGEGPGSAFYRQTAIDSGLSPFAILTTEGVQSSTRGEAAAILRLMQARNMQTVIVVTEPYHTQRARIIFRDAFKGSGLEVRVHPVPDHWYRPDSWFLSVDGWSMTLNEFIKIAAYRLGIHRSPD